MIVGYSVLNKYSYFDVVTNILNKNCKHCKYKLNKNCNMENN